MISQLLTLRPARRWPTHMSNAFEKGKWENEIKKSHLKFEKKIRFINIYIHFIKSYIDNIHEKNAKYKC